MKDVLKNIIRRQQQELGRILAKKLLTRSKESELVSGLSSTLVKAITGPRRAGKSTLALQTLSAQDTVAGKIIRVMPLVRWCLQELESERYITPTV